jgi:hypothetical protein
MALKTLTRHGDEEINRRMPRPSLHKTAFWFSLLKYSENSAGFSRDWPSKIQGEKRVTSGGVIGNAKSFFRYDTCSKNPNPP